MTHIVVLRRTVSLTRDEPMMWADDLAREKRGEVWMCVGQMGDVEVAR